MPKSFILTSDNVAAQASTDKETSVVALQKPSVDEAQLVLLERKLTEMLGDKGQFFSKMSSSQMRPRYDHALTLVMGMFDFKTLQNGTVQVVSRDTAPWNNTARTNVERYEALEWFTKTTATLIALAKLPPSRRSDSPLHAQLQEQILSCSYTAPRQIPRDDQKQIQKNDGPTSLAHSKKNEDLPVQESVPPVPQTETEPKSVPRESSSSYRRRAEAILDSDQRPAPSTISSSKSLIEDMRKTVRKGRPTDASYLKVADDWMKASEALLRVFEEDPKRFEESYEERRKLSRSLYAAAIALEKSGINPLTEATTESPSQEPPRLMPLEATNLYNRSTHPWFFSQAEIFSKGARQSLFSMNAIDQFALVGTQRIDDSRALQVGQLGLGGSQLSFIGLTEQLSGSERNGTRMTVGIGDDGEKQRPFFSYDARSKKPIDSKGSEIAFTLQGGVRPDGAPNLFGDAVYRGSPTYDAKTRTTSNKIANLQASFGVMNADGINGAFIGMQSRQAVEAVPTIPKDRYLTNQWGLGAYRPGGAEDLVPGLFGATGVDGRFKNMYYYFLAEGVLNGKGSLQTGGRAGIEWVVDKRTGLRIGVATFFGPTLTPGGFDLPLPVRLGSGLPFSLTIRF